MRIRIKTIDGDTHATQDMDNEEDRVEIEDFVNALRELRTAENFRYRTKHGSLVFLNPTNIISVTLSNMPDYI